MSDIKLDIFNQAQQLQHDLLEFANVPEAGLPADTHQILASSLTWNTRGYIEKVANQINGAFGKGWFDASAVMTRRLVETLIIEPLQQNLWVDSGSGRSPIV